jgi:hypothetical protein
MEVSGKKLDSGGKREDLQWIQVLVPLRHISLDPNIRGRHCCLKVGSGYSDEDLPLEEIIFLDTWDIRSSKD